MFTELWRGDDVGYRGLHGHGRRSVVRRQGSTGRAPGLLWWYERNGLGARTVRLYRRFGTTYRPQTTTVA